MDCVPFAVRTGSVQPKLFIIKAEVCVSLGQCFDVLLYRCTWLDTHYYAACKLPYISGMHLPIGQALSCAALVSPL